ncbi:ATP-grasp domain-containing protein [Spirochaetota bacterium]
MPSLYYHRMIEGFPEKLYESVSFAAGYSKRAFVLTTPEKNDHVLIDPCEGMDISFPDLPLLNEQGLGPPPENVHVVNFNHDLEWSVNKENNKDIINTLKKIDFDNLFPFTGKSGVVHNLASQLNLKIRSAPKDASYWAEDKRSLVDLSGLSNVPFAYKCSNNEELILNYEKLINRKGYPGKAVVKASQAASGTVSAVVETMEHLKDFMGHFKLEELDGGIIEEWFESDEFSPSINYFIYPDGKYKILFISDQIFEDSKIALGKEGTRIYRGNRFPSKMDSGINNKIIELTDPLVKALYSNGYWGPVGFDTIVAENSRVYITEINPRITGPHFGWRPMKNLGLSCFSLQNEKIGPHVNFNALRNAIEDQLFYKGKDDGYIILNFFPGKFIGVCVSGVPQRLDEIRSNVEEKLGLLI